MTNIKILHEVGFVKQITNPYAPSDIRSAFYFDPSSKRQESSAIKWANVDWIYNPNNKLSPYFATPAINSSDIPPIVRPNYFMEGLVLRNLETRAEGGRAYKVVYPQDETLFDIREDQMLQAILLHGVEKGGKIGGKWVWAMNHTQPKCFLADSEEYLQTLQENKHQSNKIE